MSRIGVIGPLCCLVFPAYSLLAQDCGVWLPGPKPPDFPSGFIPQQFVTNGSDIFARVQRLSATSDLWRFDGSAWTLLPWDRSAFGEPDAITYENNQLAVAARKLTPTSPGNFELKVAVYTWDGAGWQEFSNLTRQFLSCTGIDAHAFDIAFFSGAWYVTGRITGPCSPIHFVYKILPGGSAWIGELDSGSVNTNLESFNGGLYLSGSFTIVRNPLTAIFINAANIAIWDGTSWSQVSGGVDGRIVNMALWQENLSQPSSTQLVVAGKFTHAGIVTATGIATRNQAGQWNALGTGIGWPPDLPFGGTWLGPAIIVPFPAGGNDVDLMVGGMLSAGGNVAQSFARWTGAAWNSLPIGLNSTPNTAVLYNGQLVAGGGFSGESVSGGDQLFGVGRFDGSHWRTLSQDGTDGIVYALFTHNGVVYAGGDFTTMDGVVAAHIAARTDGVWEPLGSGTNGSVHVITFFNGEIVAGGTFNQAGGVIVRNVAAWNGNSWRSLGLGLDGLVEGLAVWNNQLVAVGEFQTDDGQSTSLPGVAVWNGTAWVPLHPGVDATQAHAVAVHQGQLYLGGGFTGGIARFTGSQLEVVGGGVLGGSVFALTSLANSLYVGGDFVGVGNNQFIPGIARWTGSQWLGLNNNGNFPNFAGEVRTLIPNADELLIGGYYDVTTGKGPVTHNMARWNGVVWRALADAYPEFRVHAATLDGDHVLAGGEFLEISNGTVSAYFAERSPVPAFMLQPEPQHVCADDGTKTVEFTATIVPDAGAQFQWQKNNGNLSDNLRISGSNTQTLSIFGVLPSDAGNYQLRAIDECGGSASSDSAALAFDGCCPGDLNNDHAVTLMDADLFADCLSGPQTIPSCTNANRANSDGDNDVDLRDAGAFQRSFAEICP